MRGTSAWAGPSRSQEISRVPTPEASDDEDSGDYDNVLGYLPVYENRIKSRQSSFADLQKLRMSHSTNGTSDFHSIDGPLNLTQKGEGLHHRQTQRNRKHSLSDGVSVVRLAALDKQEDFKDATDDINREIQENKCGQND